MSIDATRWAWCQENLSPAEKLVLLSLADRANETHACWPSIERLASDTGLEERTIYRNIKRLAELGIISISHRTGPKNANSYQLIGVPVRESAPDKKSPLTKSHPCQDVTLTQCQSDPDTVSPESIIEPITKRKKEVSKKASPASGENRQSYNAMIEDYTPDAELRRMLGEFIVMRQRIRVPITNEALRLTFADLDKHAQGDTALKTAIVSQSVQRAWRGVFPLKADLQPARASPPAKSFFEREDEANRRLAEEWARQ